MAQLVKLVVGSAKAMVILILPALPPSLPVMAVILPVDATEYKVPSDAFVPVKVKPCPMAKGIPSHLTTPAVVSHPYFSPPLGK